MKFGIGFTQETAEVSSPLLDYIDLLTLLHLLHAYTMCRVVTVFTLYRISNRSSRSAALPYPEHGCRRMPTPMRSPCIIYSFVYVVGRDYYGPPSHCNEYPTLQISERFFFQHRGCTSKGSTNNCSEKNSRWAGRCILKRSPKRYFFFFSYHCSPPAQLVRAFTLPPATSWTSRGLRCLRFSPPALAFMFIVHWVQHSHFSAFYARRFASNFNDNAQSKAVSLVGKPERCGSSR